MKSIEELARELVERMERSPFCDLATKFTQFTALKSALEKPVEKESEWPKYFEFIYGGHILRFDSEDALGIHLDDVSAERRSLVWSYPHAVKSKILTATPTAEALAIIEKAKIK